VAGIFGAIADKINIDANILRIFFVVIALIPPIGWIPLTIFYLIFWAIIPLEQPQHETYKNKANGFAS
jgi:phage shock protein PspC (stress-responsive transcriptional regulator)